MKHRFKTLAILLISVFCANAQQQVELPLIPQPSSLKTGSTSFIIDKQTILVLPKYNQHHELISNFSAQLSAIIGQNVTVSNKTTSKSSIQFSIKQNLKAEAYELNITKHKIEISAAKPAGWFYGWQTLIQILSQEARMLI